MVTKLKANTTYRLVDKDGWFAIDPMNEEFFTLHFNHNNEITLEAIDEVGNGFCKSDGFCKGDLVIDAESDLKFFEEKLKPKSWQEQVCEDFDVKLCSDGYFCFQHRLTEHRVIEMAKRIIELTEGEIK